MIGNYDGNRENNFTLVRLLFAWAVLFGHSYPITGNGSDPITRLILPHAWIGSLAVGGFFVVSGFLVTASFTARGPLAFVLSRGARLYPAVIVYCAVALFVIGPLSTGIGVIAYARLDRLAYLKNALLWNFQENLPGVFAGHPFAGSTNGSTWTLPAELRCYVMVFALGIVGVFKRRWLANITLIAIIFTTTDHYSMLPLFGGEARFAEPLLYFVIGSMAWVNRASIPLSLPLAIAAFVAPFVAAKTLFFPPVLTISLAYVTLYLVYKLPHIDIDRRIGDISYGVYIYAWPIQQLVWSPGQSGLLNAVYATAIVVPLAYLSWRLVEKPALSARRLMRTTRPKISGSTSGDGSTRPNGALRG